MNNLTNDLKHTITTKDKQGNNVFIKIRLSDECKNGHQDFSITCDIYEKDKPKLDKYFLMGGCCHEEILKIRPDLKIFVNLHLCDYLGNPMHATANGLYHLRNGFNKTPINSPLFKTEFCEYYRITANQFEVLKECKNQVQYYQKLVELDILKQWKMEADKAIEMLEQMTGQKFLVDSKRTQLIAPKTEEIAEELERQKNGYYTPEAEQKREIAKRDGILAELEAERDKEINKHITEFEVKKQVLLIGGEAALNNCIFYNHSKTLAFNWRSYDMISEEQYKHIADNIALPDGVKIEDNKGKR